MFNESQGAIAAQGLASDYTGTPVEESAILTSLGHWPGVTVSAGWNAHRIQNTVLRGGYGRKAISGKGTVNNFVRNNVNPRSWGRFRDAGQVHGYNETYTPANFLANVVGNKGYAKFVTNASEDSFIRKRATAYGLDVDDTDAFQSGALGKFTASNKLYNSRKFKKKSYNSVMDYIGKNDSNLMTHIDNVMGGRSVSTEMALLGDGSKAAQKSANKAMGDFVSMTGEHGATNLIGGYMSASRGAVDETVKTVASRAGKESFIKGAAMAERHLAAGGMEHVGAKLVMKETGEKVGLKLLGEGFAKAAGEKAALKFGSAIGMKAAGMAIPGVNVVMAAWMAYDLTNMAMDLGKGAVNLVKDGVVSMKGQIDKPIMGMGFRDNEIAATSRARGVSAIQNSRLNARSVLGSEAAGMFAHYG